MQKVQKNGMNMQSKNSKYAKMFKLKKINKNKPFFLNLPLTKSKKPYLQTAKYAGSEFYSGILAKSLIPFVTVK